MTSTQYVARCSICGVAPFSENDPKGLGYTLKHFPERPALLRRSLSPESARLPPLRALAGGSADRSRTANCDHERPNRSARPRQ